MICHCFYHSFSYIPGFVIPATIACATRSMHRESPYPRDAKSEPPCNLLCEYSGHSHARCESFEIPFRAHSYQRNLIPRANFPGSFSIGQNLLRSSFFFNSEIMTLISASDYHCELHRCDCWSHRFATVLRRLARIEGLKYWLEQTRPTPFAIYTFASVAESLAFISCSIKLSHNSSLPRLPSSAK